MATHCDGRHGGIAIVVEDRFLVVGRWVDRTAIVALDGYISPTGATSVRAALEGDTTLGGACADLIVASSANISALEQDDAEFLQITFQLTVYGQ